MNNSVFSVVDPAQTDTRHLHGMLLGAIAPRPIALTSTVDGSGRPNLAPFSFFNIFGANPPVLIFSPARRGRDNTTKHTYENILEVPEAVINVVTFDILHRVNQTSADYPKGVSEFEQAGLTPIPSDLVRPFRVKESPVQMECRVMEVIETGTGPAAGNLILCEIVRIHVDQTILTANGRIDIRKLDLVGRMGDDLYIRAIEEALFELPKPG